MADRLEKLILVRHPQTVWENMVKDPESSDHEKRLLGRTDIGLSEAGKKHLEKIAEYLKGYKINSLYSSPLERAKTLAKAIGKIKNLEFKLEDDLKEIDFGRCEGLSFLAVRKNYPEVFENYVNQSLDLNFPGGESLNEFANRIRLFFERLVKNEKDTVAVVAHGGVIRAALSCLLGLSPDYIWNIKQDYGAINILEFLNGKFIVDKINYTL